MAPTTGLVKDPCAGGLPKIWTVARMVMRVEAAVHCRGLHGCQYQIDLKMMLVVVSTCQYIHLCAIQCVYIYMHRCICMCIYIYTILQYIDVHTCICIYVFTRILDAVL